MQSLIDAIRARQSALRFIDDPQEHRPEMLYFGCVDARLDPIADIGIDKGRSIIFRNIAALLLADDAPAGAVLEFFLNHIPQPGNRTKQIVVSGHTDCGGLKACLAAPWDPNRDHFLPAYLDHLRDALRRVREQGWDDAQALKALERESVRQSMANLMTYEVVRKAVETKTVEVHGWILDTHSGRILEMDPKSGEFHPMYSSS